MVRHRNNIGFVRLILASCVIIGHAPEMIDGNNSREPVARFMPTMTMGWLAVGGFFLLSGYLITISMLRSPSSVTFLERRIFRIYPAFVIAFLVSVFVVGSLAGANPFQNLPEAILRIVLLHKPGTYSGVFPGLVIFPDLNGAMWTIFHEFRCYLLILILGMAGILHRRGLMVVLTTVITIAFVIQQFFPVDGWPVSGKSGTALQFLFGPPDQIIRLTAIFMIGSCIALFRDGIIPKLTFPLSATLCLLGIMVAVADDRMAEPALIIFGALPLFWLSLKASLGRLQPINDKWDISYGVYLYGWPIATYIRWRYPTIDPWTLAAVTLFFAVIAGTLSWHLIERRTKDLRLVDRIGSVLRRPNNARMVEGR